MAKKVKKEEKEEDDEPEANPSTSSTSQDQDAAGTQDPLPEGIRERVISLESRSLLAGSSNRPVPKDVYARLKALEDRVAYLASVSPEYLDILEIKKETSNVQGGSGYPDHRAEQMRKIKSEERSHDISKSLSGINTRIQELQASLKASNKSDTQNND